MILSPFTFFAAITRALGRALPWGFFTFPLLLLVATPTIAQAQADHPAPLITAEDLLSAEQIGPVQISPDGETALISILAGADRVADSSFEDASVAGQHLHLVDLSTGATRPLGRPFHHGAIPGPAWSPTGSHFALYEVRGEDLGLSVANRASGEIVTLPGRWGQLASWSQNTLLYDALPPDRIHPLARRQLLDNLARRWTSAWSGSGAFSVSDRSGTFESGSNSQGALLAYDVAGGHPFRVAEGDFISVVPSPTGDAFAAVRLSEAERDPLNSGTRRGELVFFVRDGRDYRLEWRADRLDVAARAISISPDGRQVLVGAKPTGADRLRLELHLVSVADGRTAPIDVSGLDLRNFDVGALNPFWQIGWVDGLPAAIASVATQGRAAELALSYGQAEGRRPDLYVWGKRGRECLTCSLEAPPLSFLARSEDRGALVIAQGRVWEVGSGRHARPMTFDRNEPVLGFGVDDAYPVRAPDGAYRTDEAGERLALWIGPPEHPLRTVVDLLSGSTRDLAPPGVRSILNPTLRGALALERDGWTQVVTYCDSAQSKRLLHLNAHLAGTRVILPEPFYYEWQGRVLRGWFLRAATGHMTPPAVVHVYGGTVQGAVPPHGAGAVVGPPVFSGQLLAAAGYTVIFPSTPVPRGIDGDVPAALSGAIVAAVDELARKRIIDPERVGLVGHSFGGYSVAAVLGQRSDRFRAGVSLAGAYDWSAAYGDVPARHRLGDADGDYLAEMKMIESGQIQLQDPFWVMPDAYRRNSPIYAVDRMTTPLLMLHGDLDLAATGLSGAERMYNALMRAGQKPALVRYWGEGHVAQAPAAMLDQWHRTLRWFDVHMRGATGN